MGGVLGPLLGFLSLLALLLTLVLQNRELEETRNELRHSRLAHEGQLAEMRAQVESAELRERRDLTFRMLERWTSVAMRDHRLAAWADLTKKFGMENGEPRATVNLEIYRRDSAESFRHFSDVCQFMSDLNKLFDKDLLDCELARLLFSDSVFPWFDYIDQIDFARQDTTDPSYEEGVENWYRTRVQTLRRHIPQRADGAQGPVGS